MPAVNGKDIRRVVIACDAGMGSSVMVASQMRQRLKKYDVAVEHVSVNQIPADTQVVLCPGVNDGTALDQTIMELAALYPTVQTISIVPVVVSWSMPATVTVERLLPS